jgi:hypothetical protein
MTLAASREPHRIDVVYFDAGSGHRSAAAALVRVLRQRLPAYEARPVNVVDLLAAHRPLQLLTGIAIALINDGIARERLLDLEGHIRRAIMLCARLSPRDHARVGRMWPGSAPAAVVSVTPLFNDVLRQGLRRARPEAPYITIPVDLEEALPRYWFHPIEGVHYLVGSQPLAEQAAAAGVTRQRLTRLSGMIVDPAFYAAAKEDRGARLAELGLDPALPVGAISFGGQGSSILPRIARTLADGQCRVNALFLCGASPSAARDLGRLDTPYPKLVLGYLPETPVGYLRLADFTIGKPGTMTIFESLVSGAPAIAIRSTGMAILQRGNERWLERSGAGLVVPRLAELPHAIRQVLDRATEFKAAGARHAGRGIFEAADAIAQLLS